MNETDRGLVSLLAQYACKFPGAIYLKMETICNATNKSEAYNKLLLSENPFNSIH